MRAWMLAAGVMALLSACSPCGGDWTHTWTGTFDDNDLLGVLSLVTPGTEHAWGTDQEGYTACSISGDIAGDLDDVSCKDRNDDWIDAECDFEGTIDGYIMPYSDGPLVGDIDADLTCTCDNGPEDTFPMANAVIGGEIDSGGRFEFEVEEFDDDFWAYWDAY